MKIFPNATSVADILRSASIPWVEERMGMKIGGARLAREFAARYPNAKQPTIDAALRFIRAARIQANTARRGNPNRAVIPPDERRPAGIPKGYTYVVRIPYTRAVDGDVSYALHLIPRETPISLNAIRLVLYQNWAADDATLPGARGLERLREFHTGAAEIAYIFPGQI